MRLFSFKRCLLCIVNCASLPLLLSYHLLISSGILTSPQIRLETVVALVWAEIYLCLQTQVNVYKVVGMTVNSV